jgi:hypothetical protein
MKSLSGSPQGIAAAAAQVEPWHGERKMKKALLNSTKTGT